MSTTTKKMFKKLLVLISKLIQSGTSGAAAARPSGHT